MSQPAVIESTGEVSRKQNLYEIGEELEAIFDSYDRMDGQEAEDFVKDSLEAYFECKASELNAKLDGYCGLIKTFEAKAKIRKDEAARLNALAQTDLNHADRLKKRLKDWLEFTGNDKVETPFHKIWRQANGGQSPLVWLTEVDGEKIPATEPPSVDAMPEQFLTVIPEQKVLNAEAIRAALQEGTELEFARLGEKGTHLRIK